MTNKRSFTLYVLEVTVGMRTWQAAGLVMDAKNTVNTLICSVMYVQNAITYISQKRRKYYENTVYVCNVLVLGLTYFILSYLTLCISERSSGYQGVILPCHGVFQFKKLGSYLNLEAHKEMGGNERAAQTKVRRWTVAHSCHFLLYHHRILLKGLILMKY